MKDAGCRLLIVGYESGDQQILKNIKKGATIDMARRFTANCKKLGLNDPWRFHCRLPGETRETIRKSIDFAKELDVETIQVSIGHPFPRHRVLRSRQEERTDHPRRSMTDDTGHQLPNYQYPGFDKGELVEWVERFYGEFYFRPKVALRLVGKAMFDNSETQTAVQRSPRISGSAFKRKQYVKDQGEQKERAAVLSAGD